MVSKDKISTIYVHIIYVEKHIPTSLIFVSHDH